MMRENSVLLTVSGPESEVETVLARLAVMVPGLTLENAQLFACGEGTAKRIACYWQLDGVVVEMLLTGTSPLSEHTLARNLAQTHLVGGSCGKKKARQRRMFGS